MKEKAAEQYLNEVRIIREETEEECQRILDQARAEAATILKKHRQGHFG